MLLEGTSPGIARTVTPRPMSRPRQQSTRLSTHGSLGVDSTPASCPHERVVNIRRSFR